MLHDMPRESSPDHRVPRVIGALVALAVALGALAEFPLARVLAGDAAPRPEQGRERQYTVQAADGRIAVRIKAGALELSDEAVLHWIRTAAQAIVAYYRR